MADFGRRDPRALHPLSAMMLSLAFPSFLGALLFDWAYFSTFEVQWKNFASWLLVGGMLGTGLAIVAAIVGLIFDGPLFRRSRGIYLFVLIATFVVGVVNTLTHAKDGWATMPTGIVLSSLSAILAMIASWIGFSGFVAKERR